jgi:hypothetical protein
MTRYPGVPTQRWTPSDLGSSLVAWFDASVTTSVTTATGGVSQWNDLSGNGYHATQGTSGNRPDSVTDGIDFVSANADRLVRTTFENNTNQRCVAAVIKPDTVSVLSCVFSHATSSNAWMLRVNASAKAQISFSGIADIVNSSTSLTAGSNAVILGNTSASAYRVSVNGNANTGSHSYSMSGATSSVTIGAHANSSETAFDGTIREVVVCGALVTADQERLEGYLAWKWGLVSSLAAGHPYKSQQP